MKRKILIVDDDEEVQSTLRAYLEGEAYEVISALNAAELTGQLNQHQVDAILLDLGLPDCDGLTLIGKIREYTEAPVIVVTGRGGMVDTVVGLEMGADDYISKPFQLRELSARIRASLRRYKGSDAGEGANTNQNIPAAPVQDAQPGSEQIEFCDWIMDAGSMDVYDREGKSAGLTTKEFELLEALASAPKRVLSREQLFDMVRPDDYDSFNRAIDIQITRIRKKLNDNAKSPEIIKTVRGVGYMMICDTHRRSA